MATPSVCCLAVAAICGPFATAGVYPWTKRYEEAQAIAARMPVPAGYRRVGLAAGSFGHWLRHLPLKPGTPAVRTFDGRLKPNQAAHAAVVDIDVGRRDLQQCADAVIRLRAEFLFSKRLFSAIHFHFTSGHRADFTKWAAGHRPLVRGNRVAWRRSARPDSSHRALRSYLTTVFIYAGSASLSKELRPVADASAMQVGDVFIRGGFPGHAVLVVDMAVHRATGKKLFLLAQSYMPAQDVHILKNPSDAALSPWYPLPFGKALRTPEWTFRSTELKRFP